MASVDRPLSPGVFAAAAQTTIPANPVPGVSYRDPVNGTSAIEQGWPFQRLVNSAEFNEVMYRITALLELVSTTSVLAWNEKIDYQGPGAAQTPSVVASTDGHLYVALQASGPNSGGPRDPATGNTAFWGQFSGLAAGADVGDVKAVATEEPPFGWLKCDGAVISRTQYPALFDAIGIRYGAGNGSTTFGLPDLRGEFVRGWDDGRGVDVDRVLGSSQAGQNASHNHDATAANDGDHSHTVSGTAAPDGAHTHGLSASATSAGGHQHLISGTAASAGAHSHSLQIGSNDIAGSRPPIVAPGQNPVAVGGAIGADGAHTHAVSGSTTLNGDHSHTVTGTAASGGAHGHAVSGTAASDGNHAHAITVADSGGNESRPRNVALLYVIKH
jgi:microcystin-dependent protein